ncbi:hypothetical protein [Longimycelium tulufanense]|uniref:hypothetical protein n=1 Tax=Longimycelium tulufanense TaxID=907463 RepID=UPI001E286F69|nr:hypothetical protein [Longimycelium tulufanense]
MTGRQRVFLLLVAFLVLAFPALPASATPEAPAELCRVTDPRLAELSGVASDGDRWYAVPDGGEQVRVYVVGRDCAVQRVITSPVDPFDVEDVARAPDGTLWLADTGDNRKQRDTVALHAVSPNGGSVLYRLSYPDGPRDAEALLLDRRGVPYLVTKEPLGGSGVYRPKGPLVAPGPSELERVGTVRVGPTDTTGGPLSGTVGSVLVTGGAVSHDGSVVALRTYTDAYLFAAPDGDVVAALGREPVRVPLPNEPQGEAIAFEPDGTLLSAGEFGDFGAGSVLRGVAGAVQATQAGSGGGRQQPLPTAPASTDSVASPSADNAEDFGLWKALGVGGIVVTAAAVLALGRRLRR